MNPTASSSSTPYLTSSSSHSGFNPLSNSDKVPTSKGKIYDHSGAPLPTTPLLSRSSSSSDSSPASSRFSSFESDSEGSTSDSVSSNATDSARGQEYYKTNFLLPFNALVNGNIADGNPPSIQVLTHFLNEMIENRIYLTGAMALPKTTNDWLAQNPAWLPIAGLLVQLKHNVDLEVMTKLLNAIETKEMDYQPDNDTGIQASLLIRCLDNFLTETTSTHDRIVLFKKLMDTIAIISVDLEHHPDNNYWVRVLKNLTYGFNIMSTCQFLTHHDDNPELIEWFGIPQVASNDPFQYFLWMLETHTSTSTQKNTNYAERLNVFMQTFLDRWGNKFPERKLVYVRVENMTDSPVHFIYTESSKRTYAEVRTTHNLKRASALQWFNHVTGTLFPTQQYDTLENHPQLNESYQQALAIYQSQRLGRCVLGTALAAASFATAYFGGRFISNYLTPSTDTAPRSQVIADAEAIPLLDLVQNAGNSTNTQAFKDLKTRIRNGASSNAAFISAQDYTNLWSRANQAILDTKDRDGEAAQTASQNATLTAIGASAATAAFAIQIWNSVIYLSLDELIAKQPLFAA
jgi:hypothetical protein